MCHKKEVKKLFDWLDSLFFGFVKLNFLLCERQLLKSQQNLNWNSNVSVSALQNDITLHKKNSIAVIVGWNFLYIMIRHICAWQFLLLLCNHFLGLKSDIYLTMSCQKLSDSPSDPIEYSSQSIPREYHPIWISISWTMTTYPFFSGNNTLLFNSCLYILLWFNLEKKGCCCCFDHLMLVLSL